MKMSAVPKAASTPKKAMAINIFMSRLSREIHASN
jgi:hypothetical protein